MKRVILGLGAGIFILLFMTASLPAFDRDINLPSPNQKDPISIYQANESDDIGWTEPQQFPGIITDGRSSINRGDIGSIKFYLNIIWIRFSHSINDILTQPITIEGEENIQDEPGQSQTISGR